MTRTEIAPLVLSVDQMNQLQHEGIISDNCITQDDIAPRDWIRVWEWVEKQGRIKPQLAQGELLSFGSVKTADLKQNAL